MIESVADSEWRDLGDSGRMTGNSEVIHMPREHALLDKWFSNTALVQLPPFRYRLAPTFPSFHDLAKRSADLTP